MHVKDLILWSDNIVFNLSKIMVKLLTFRTNANLQYFFQNAREIFQGNIALNPKVKVVVSKSSEKTISTFCL